MNRIGICIQESLKINKSMSDTQHLSSDPNTTRFQYQLGTKSHDSHTTLWSSLILEAKHHPKTRKNTESPTFCLQPPDQIPFMFAILFIPKTEYHVSDYHTF